MDAVSRRRYVTTDPTIEKPLAEAPDGDAADVHRAYEAAAVVRANAEELATSTRSTSAACSR